MKTLFTLVASGLLLGSLSIGAFAKGNAATPIEKHPKIRQAINALEAARGDLQKAAHDFCGHRAEALEASDNAIKQLRLALESDQAMNLAYPNLERANFMTTIPPVENHPMIQRAIRALNAAKDDLQHAAHDFHGHRVEAIEAVNRAQNQLRLALACDKK